MRATALERAGSALFSLVFYLGKSLSPAGLSPVYEANAHSYAGTLWVGAGALACIGAAACLRRWRPFALTALAYYAITLFPVMGFFQLSPQRAADRYSYLPCLVWSLGLGAGLAAAARSRRPAVRRAFPALLIAAAAATAGLGGLAVRQGAVWHDSVSLWRRALRLDPDSSIARHNLAVGLLEQKRWGEAILYLEEQVRLFPADTPSRELLAKLIARTGTTARDHAKIHAELGYEYERNGEREKAAWHFRKALGYDPSRDLRASLDEALARVGARPVGR